MIKSIQILCFTEPIALYHKFIQVKVKKFLKKKMKKKNETNQLEYDAHLVRNNKNTIVIG